LGGRYNVDQSCQSSIERAKRQLITRTEKGKKVRSVEAQPRKQKEIMISGRHIKAITLCNPAN